MLVPLVHYSRPEFVFARRISMFSITGVIDRGANRDLTLTNRDDARGCPMNLSIFTRKPLWNFRSR
jgi:hypothetical protein